MLADIIVMSEEETLTDGSKVYSVIAIGHGSYSDSYSDVRLAFEARSSLDAFELGEKLIAALNEHTNLHVEWR